MSVVREGGSVRFTCDSCADAFEPDAPTTSFNEAWAEAKEEGWRFRDGEHHCPSCAEDR